MTCLYKSLCLLGTLSIFVAFITPAHGVVAFEWCRYNETQEGRCLTERQCDENHLRGPPDPTVYCGFDKDVRLVCCPLLKVYSQSQKNPTVDDPTKPGKVAKKCEYMQMCALFTEANAGRIN
ncbi:hypothetical protein J437_LFUL008368 [Ladona fulva]|uniref:Uncharacterized protein n=1 Tax=Ladona fulva TaxID=123851 RepID=A0A8K0K8W6_LADFU|nr:hypothetical protein J437_LFUL008368 [Ladona fulva]